MKEIIDWFHHTKRKELIGFIIREGNKIDMVSSHEKETVF